METEFINILSRHQGIILKVCRLYCNHQNDAEDLFQEIVLQLWKSYPTFQGKAKISTWLYRIALNTAITRLRKQKSLTVSFISLETIATVQQEQITRIDVQYEQQLYKAIGQLNKFDKALVMLYLDDKNYEEMAEIMGISENYIGVKINRIKKKLKEIINRQ